MSLDNSVTRKFPINVKEPSKLEGLPAEVEAEIGDSGGVSLAGLDRKLSDNDNPFGWSNWFLFLVASFVGFWIFRGNFKYSYLRYSSHHFFYGFSYSLCVFHWQEMRV